MYDLVLTMALIVPTRATKLMPSEKSIIDTQEQQSLCVGFNSPIVPQEQPSIVPQEQPSLCMDFNSPTRASNQAYASF